MLFAQGEPHQHMYDNIVSFSLTRASRLCGFRDGGRGGGHQHLERILFPRWSSLKKQTNENTRVRGGDRRGRRGGWEVWDGQQQIPTRYPSVPHPIGHVFSMRTLDTVIGVFGTAVVLSCTGHLQTVAVSP